MSLEQCVFFLILITKLFAQAWEPVLRLSFYYYSDEDKYAKYYNPSTERSEWGKAAKQVFNKYGVNDNDIIIDIWRWSEFVQNFNVPNEGKKNTLHKTLLVH